MPEYEAGLSNSFALFNNLINPGCPARLSRQVADASVPVATGIEALLVKADSQLAAGDNASFIATLNAARATVPALAASPLVDPDTANNRVNPPVRSTGMGT